MFIPAAGAQSRNRLVGIHKQPRIRLPSGNLANPCTRFTLEVVEHVPTGNYWDCRTCLYWDCGACSYREVWSTYITNGTVEHVTGGTVEHLNQELWSMFLLVTVQQVFNGTVEHAPTVNCGACYYW